MISLADIDDIVNWNSINHRGCSIMNDDNESIKRWTRDLRKSFIHWKSVLFTKFEFDWIELFSGKGNDRREIQREGEMNEMMKE